MYRCKSCGKTFRSRKAYIMHIILGLEGGYVKKGGKNISSQYSAIEDYIIYLS